MSLHTSTTPAAAITNVSYAHHHHPINQVTDPILPQGPLVMVVVLTLAAAIFVF